MVEVAEKLSLKARSSELFDRANSELSRDLFRYWLCFVYGYLSWSISEQDLANFESYLKILKRNMVD